MKNLNRGVDYSKGAYLFLMPNMIGFMLFVFLPVVASLGLSFCEWHILDQDKSIQFVGFRQFVQLIGDVDFWRSVYNTVFMMMAIPIGMMLSLCLALLLNKGVRAIRVFRMVYFLPTITAGVALLVLWSWIYDSQYGLMNQMLAKIGIEGPAWLTGEVGFLKDWFQWIHQMLAKINIEGPAWLVAAIGYLSDFFGGEWKFFWSKFSLMLMGLWTGIGGYNMVLYLAGLQGINPELYEAAEVDGAGAWQKFKHITWPMLAPTTFFISIMSLIGGFQGGFQAAYVMTQGGPEHSTETISFKIFQHLYENDRTGYASAIAWVLFLVVFILTMISWRFGGKVVHYD